MLAHLWKRPLGLVALAALLFLYTVALAAPFLAPYRASDQQLKKTFHPPTKVFWHDGGWRVKVYQNIDPTAAIYQPMTDGSVPLHWFVRGYEYKWLGLIPCRRHLFGVASEARVYLLGSDNTGRDIFSRLVYGAPVSLGIGLIGITISLWIGLLVGGLAGYFGGWWDGVAMRVTELLMAIPGLYLLLSLRSVFAGRHYSQEQIFLLITVTLSFIGWSGTARVVRGLVLSLRQRPFIAAAEVLGVPTLWILFRHLLPNMASYLLVAATLSIPGYILGEAALSFLGIGIQEPGASWGLMLAQAQEMKVFMLNFWWLLTPGLAIFVTVMAFNVLGDVLRDAVDPKFKVMGK